MRRILPIVALCLGLLATGCGETDDSTPVACLESSPTYLKALETAPGEVALGDGTLISECLAPNQTAGDLATVGLILLRTTTKLNTGARAEPGGDANLRLGYLLGAAQRGAEQTEGIHDELVRRLTAAARYSPEGQLLPATFLHTYQQGFDAGRAGG
jgi:hypothetical protein